VGRRVTRRSGSWPGAGDDALRVVSGRLVRGFSSSRWRDAGLGRRGVFSYCGWDLFRPITGARRVADLRGVAGVRRRGVAGVWWWGCESGLFAYVTRLQSYKSRVLAYIAGVLTDITCLLTDVAGLFADFASILSYESGLFPEFTSILAYVTGL
jgi:hypothetical protein